MDGKFHSYRVDLLFDSIAVSQHHHPNYFHMLIDKCLVSIIVSNTESNCSDETVLYMILKNQNTSHLSL